MRVVVLVPTYNELEALPTTMDQLLQAVPDVAVLVIDDSSPDGTGELADAMAAADDRISVLHRAQKEGLGRAYLHGMRVALAGGADVVVEFDADGSHPADAVPRMLAQLEAGADLAIGSRWVPRGAVHNWPLHRLLLSRGANLYVGALLGLGVSDATAGFRVFRAELLEQLIATDIASQGYCFQIDMTRRARDLGAAIAEVPIDFDERTAGASKMSSRIVREALVKVTSWGLSRRTQGLRKALG